MTNNNNDTASAATAKSIPHIQTGQGEYTKRISPWRRGKQPHRADVSKSSKSAIDLSSFLIPETESDYYTKCSPPYLTSGLLNLFRHCPWEFHQQWIANNGRTKRLQYLDRYNRFVADYIKNTSHEHAQNLLSNGIADGVVRTKIGEFECQARIGWINPDPKLGISELKTTVSLDTFELDIIQNEYAHQLAFYRNLIYKVSGHILPAHLIAVEVDTPHKCGVWRLSQSSLDIAQADNDAAIVGIAQCKKYNSWPTGYEQIRTFTMPHIYPCFKDDTGSNNGKQC